MKYIFIAFCFSLAFMSCKKSSDPSKTELMTKSAWYYDNGGIGDASGNITYNFTSLGSAAPQACALDNYVNFSSDGSGVTNEGATKCSPSAPQTTNFSWSLSSNETVLNITGSAFVGLGGQFKLLTLTDTKLGLTKDTTITGLGATTMVFYLKHQ